MKKEVNKIFISFIIVSVGLLSMDILAGTLFDKLWFAMPYSKSEVARANYYINEAEADVVVIGASRATHHYVPEILSDSLGMSVIVTGRDGHDFVYNSCVLHSILSRHIPRLVIFDLGEGLITGATINRITSLAPYYKCDDYIRNAINEVGDWSTPVLMYSNLYRYNGKILKLVNGYFAKKENRSGYIPIYPEPNLKSEGIKLTKKVEPRTPHPIEMEHLMDIFNWSKLYGFEIIVFDSPRYQINEDNYNLIRLLCRNYEIPCFDLSNDSVFLQHPEWFKDESHLNDDGAHIYTLQIAEIIHKSLFFNQ